MFGYKLIKEEDYYKLSGILSYLETSRLARRETLFSDDEMIQMPYGKERAALLNMNADLKLVIKELRNITRGS